MLIYELLDSNKIVLLNYIVDIFVILRMIPVFRKQINILSQMVKSLS